MIGDGPADAEAKKAKGEGANVFIGFGGQARVEEVADWYLHSFNPLVDLLKAM